MAVNLSIKEVPEDLAERLRQRAARHHRSLQGELMAIIEQAVGNEAAAPAATAWGLEPERRVRGDKTIEQLMAERKAAGWKPHASLARAPLAVDLVRADRDAR